MQFLKYLFTLEQVYDFIIMENNIIKNIDQKMVKTIESLKKDFVSIQAGRANPNILDNIFVDYYGSSMPINQLANFTTPEPQLLVNGLGKGCFKEIENSIIKANLAFPQSDGVSYSPAHSSFNRRENSPLELVKQVKKIGEESKNSVRISSELYNSQIILPKITTNL